MLDAQSAQLLQNMHNSIQVLVDDNKDFVQRLTRIETNQTDILGNGQPGRLAKVESGLKGLKAYKDKVTGIVAAVTFICGGTALGLWKLWTIVSAAAKATGTP